MKVFERVGRELGPMPEWPTDLQGSEYDAHRTRYFDYQKAFSDRWEAEMRAKYSDLNDATFNLLFRRSVSGTIGEGYEGAEREFENQYRLSIELIRAATAS